MLPELGNNDLFSDYSQEICYLHAWNLVFQRPWRWWEEEPYRLLVTESKVKVNFKTLSIKPCGTTLYNIYSFEFTQSYFRPIQILDWFAQTSCHQRNRYNVYITLLQEGQGNPIRVSMICNPRWGLPIHGSCWKTLTQGQDSLVPPSYLDYLALTFYDIIGGLLPELACVTLQGS